MRLIDLTHVTMRKSASDDLPPLVVRSVTNIDRVPLEYLVTSATVADLTSRPRALEVRRADLAKRGVSDIRGCILRTGWMDDHLAGGGGEAPILDVDAAAYLLEGGVRTVAADFPIIADAGDLLLHNGCVLVYCISNVGELSGRIVRLVALPLKQADTFSAEARVIAVEE